MKTLLTQKLKEAIEMFLSNGVTQRSPGWDTERTRTIGASEIGAVMGVDPYRGIDSVISAKLFGKQKSSDCLVTGMGVLFEELIQRITEYDFDTEIMGENSFVPGEGNTSCSPDGLGIIRYIPEYENNISLPPRHAIALFEFKFLFSRTPSGKPPPQYLAQVLYSMDILRKHIPVEVGILAETVFRRCGWDDLGTNPMHDLILTPRRVGKQPIAYGFIGFTGSRAAITQIIDAEERGRANSAAKACGGCFSDDADADMDIEPLPVFACMDFGSSTREGLSALISLYLDGEVSAEYCSTIHLTPPGMFACGEVAGKDTTPAWKFPESAMSDITAVREAFIAKAGESLVGILPWKLFSIDYHYISPQEGYIDSCAEKIKEVFTVLDELRSEDPDMQRALLTHYSAQNGRGFSDD